jgi:hypothetical protein
MAALRSPSKPRSGLLLGRQLLLAGCARCLSKRRSGSIRVHLSLEPPDLFAFLLRRGACCAGSPFVWILRPGISALFVVESATDTITAA